ncbi:hypothetical protein PCE1_000748 [Barthelona sp. PCE]
MSYTPNRMPHSHSTPLNSRRTPTRPKSRPSSRPNSRLKRSEIRSSEPLSLELAFIERLTGQLTQAHQGLSNLLLSHQSLLDSAEDDAQLVEDIDFVSELLLRASKCQVGKFWQRLATLSQDESGKQSQKLSNLLTNLTETREDLLQDHAQYEDNEQDENHSGVKKNIELYISKSMIVRQRLADLRTEVTDDILSNTDFLVAYKSLEDQVTEINDAITHLVEKLENEDTIGNVNLFRRYVRILEELESSAITAEDCAFHLQQENPFAIVSSNKDPETMSMKELKNENQQLLTQLHLVESEFKQFKTNSRRRCADCRVWEQKVNSLRREISQLKQDKSVLELENQGLAATSPAKRTTPKRNSIANTSSRKTPSSAAIARGHHHSTPSSSVRRPKRQSTPELLSETEYQQLVVGSLSQHMDAVTCLDLDYGEPSRFITGSADNTLRLWRTAERDPETGMFGQRALADDGICEAIGVLKGHTDSITDVSMHRFSSHVASVSEDRTLRLWGIGPEDENGEMPTVSNIGMLKLSGSVSNCCLFSPYPQDYDMLAIGGYKVVSFVDTTQDTLVNSINAHTLSVYDMCFNANSSVLATCSDDKHVKLFDYRSRECIFDKNLRTWLFSVDFSPTGNHFAVGGHNGKITIFDWRAGKVFDEIITSHDSARVVRFASDEILLSGGQDMNVKIWDITKNQCTHCIPGHRATVKDILYNPHDSLLISCGCDKLVRLFDSRELVPQDMYAYNSETEEEIDDVPNDIHEHDSPMM